MAIFHQNKKASRRLPVQASAPPRISPLGPAVAAGGLLFIAGALGYGFVREEPQAEAPAPAIASTPMAVPRAEPDAPRPPAGGAARPYAVPEPPRLVHGRAPRAEDYAPKVDGRVLASAPAATRPSEAAAAAAARPAAPVTLKAGRPPLTPEQEAKVRKSMAEFEAQYRKRKLEEAVRKAEESMRPPAGAREEHRGEAAEEIALDGRPGEVPSLTAAQTAKVEEGLAEIKTQQAKGVALPAPLAKVLAEHGWEGLRRAAIRAVAAQQEGAQ